jgi:hypothetical protein
MPADSKPRRPAALLSSVAAPAIVRRLDSSFSGQLSIGDRRKLRSIVIKTHRHLFAADPSTRHIDQVIDALGPEVARKAVLKALAEGKVA